MSSAAQSRPSLESYELTLQEMSTTQELRMDLERIKHELRQEDEQIDAILADARALTHLVMRFAEDYL